MFCHCGRQQPAYLLGRRRKRSLVESLYAEQLEARLLLSANAPDIASEQIGESAALPTMLSSPDLIWSTYLNGTLGDSGSAVAIDSVGNVVVAGTTSQSLWTVGGYDTTLGGSSDAFVAKLTPAPSAENS